MCFENFLELFASEYPEELHLIQVDKVGFHNSLNLSIAVLNKMRYTPLATDARGGHGGYGGRESTSCY